MCLSSRVLFSEIMDELEMTPDEFAKRLRTTSETVSLLLDGQMPVSNDLAMKLSDMLGISADTWLNLQKAYDERKKSTVKVN